MVGLTYRQSLRVRFLLPVVVQGFVRLVLLATCLLQTVQRGYPKLLAVAQTYRLLVRLVPIQNPPVLILFMWNCGEQAQEAAR